jgi:ribosomal protein L37E
MAWNQSDYFLNDGPGSGYEVKLRYYDTGPHASNHTNQPQIRYIVVALHGAGYNSSTLASFDQPSPTHVLHFSKRYLASASRPVHPNECAVCGIQSTRLRRQLRWTSVLSSRLRWQSTSYWVTPSRPFSFHSIPPLIRRRTIERCADCATGMVQTSSLASIKQPVH